MSSVLVSHAHLDYPLVGIGSRSLKTRLLVTATGGLISSGDAVPVVKALRDIRFAGFASIFMHPTPRGVPILPTAGEITAAVNQSREYVERCLRETA